MRRRGMRGMGTATACLSLFALIGCYDIQPPAGDRAAAKQASPVASTPRQPTAPRQPEAKKASTSSAPTPTVERPIQRPVQHPNARKQDSPEQDSPANALPDSPHFEGTADMAGSAAWFAPPPALDDAKATAAGLRKIVGRHLTLHTDLPPSAEVDALPEVFDQAFGQWCDYFHVDRAKHADWHATGFLMKDKKRFESVGALPADVPDFPHGYARGLVFWLHEQPSDYYRRHLVLHEGTHSFMHTVLGASGPPWYTEGTAELLATHRWQDGRLAMNYFPRNRAETPLWGRIKFVREAYTAGRALHLGNVLGFDGSAFKRTESYAWAWALCAMLDGDPRYQARFRQLVPLVARPDFNERFLALIGRDLPELNEQWQVFLADLDYGYDVARSAVVFSPPDGRPSGPPTPGGTTVRVAADRSWQSSGVRLEAGKTYRLEASGRFQIAKTTQAWQCEPGGVTIRYHQGQPLGILLAAVRPDPKPGFRLEESEISPLVHPIVVGLGTTLRPTVSGTLFLKLNDSPTELHDNAGAAAVRVTAEGPG